MTAVRRLRPRAYRRLTLFALVALCGIVVTGASVRLTGSGLGCPDWPICAKERPVPEADLHAWIEFGNRLLTGVVSVAVVLAVLGSWWRSPRRRDLVWLSWALVAGVIAQIVVGAFTVWWHLPPGIVMVHFSLSMVLVAAATLLHLRAGEDDAAATAVPAASAAVRRPVVGGAARTVVHAVFGWLWVVLVAGTVVTAAGPHRGDPDVEPLALPIPQVARLHGISVVVFLAGVVWLVRRTRRDDLDHGVRGAAELVLGVALAQAAIGYVQYFTDVPVLLVGAHIAGATALTVTVTRLWWTRDRRCVQPVTAPSAARALTPT